jgi:hypothetical protein
MVLLPEPKTTCFPSTENAIQEILSTWPRKIPEIGGQLQSAPNTTEKVFGNWDLYCSTTRDVEGENRSADR